MCGNLLYKDMPSMVSSPEPFSLTMTSDLLSFLSPGKQAHVERCDDHENRNGVLRCNIAIYSGRTITQ